MDELLRWNGNRILLFCWTINLISENNKTKYYKTVNKKGDSGRETKILCLLSLNNFYGCFLIVLIFFSNWMFFK